MKEYKTGHFVNIIAGRNFRRNLDGIFYGDDSKITLIDIICHIIYLIRKGE
jgi:hypothetical protein